MNEFPRIQLIPKPLGHVAFEVGGEAKLGYYHGASLPRPYLYPLIGPAGRSLIRMGHPGDPHGHRHHRGIWTGHHKVNGENVWNEDTPYRIQCERVVELADGEVGRLVTKHRWLDGDRQPLLHEQWSITYHELPESEAVIEMHLEYTPADRPITLGQTPFGFLGLRVAKTMSVRYGAGRIVNSEGQVNEEEILWQRARWVDYSGLVAEKIVNGVTVMDAAENPRHPTYWHVRDDGWIGASFCYAEPFDLVPTAPLELRYGLYVHDGPAEPARIERHYADWTARP